MIITKKEFAWIIIAIIISAFVMGLTESLIYDVVEFIMLLIIAALILGTSVITKKIAGEHYCIQIEHKIWEFQRFGYYERSRFKKPFPIGLILPFAVAFFTLGTLKPLTFLQFDAKNLHRKRLLRQRGSKQGQRKQEINESDLAFTAAWGFYALLLLAIIGALIKVPELTLYTLTYNLWNLIPFGQLDGTKIFFGSILNWAILVILSIIGLLLVIVL